MRKFGPFDTSVFYEVENRRLQRALAIGGQASGFVRTGQGAVTAGTGAQLVIAAYPDGALIDGMYVENPASEAVTLTTNTGSTNPRIDRLVMRLDMTAKTIEPFQIVGTPASSPSAPNLTQDATTFDLPLCQYRFPGSGSPQNPGSIVDERLWVAPGGVFGIELSRVGNVAINNAQSENQGFSSGQVVRDVGGYFTGSGTTVLTVPTGMAGLHLISFSADIDGGPQAARFIVSAVINGGNEIRANGYGDDHASAAETRRLAVGDRISVSAYQQRGVRNLTALRLNVHRIGP